MTDTEARLAALDDALHAWARHFKAEPRDDYWTPLCQAMEVLREARATIAADLELAAAVRSMGASWLVDHSAPEQGIDVRIWTYDEANGDTEHRGSGPTLDAAINEALRDE